MFCFAKSDKCLYQQMKMERNEFTTANSRANESHCIQIDYPGVVSTGLIYSHFFITKWIKKAKILNLLLTL